MELRDYVIPLRKWWWLILAATLLGAVSSYIATGFQVPQYRARATLMLGQAIEDPNPSGLEFYTTQQLATTYSDIAKRQPVQAATMEKLGLTWLPGYDVRPLANTQLLEISVTDTSPERVQAVANTLAEQLVRQSPTSQGDQQRESFINDQLDGLEEQIMTTESEIGELQRELGDMISARQIADAQEQIASLQSKMTALQTNYATLVSNTERGALNSLRIIESASLPTQPINDNTLNTVLLGAAIGFALSVGAAYLLEYLDDSLKTPEEVSKTLEAPVIGFIMTSETNGRSEQSVVVAESPRSAIAEAFRALRTNLEFADVDRPLKTILITSPGPGDGKSTVATNLAVSMAQGNRTVALIDADLRRPRVHQFAGLNNNFGLSDVFRGRMEVGEAMQEWGVSSNIRVITSGGLPPNPAELLKSARMDEILEELSTQVDVVLIDSPPVVVTDPSILAAKVDGVLVIMRPGTTDTGAAKALVEQMKRADARVVGVVMNRIPRRRGYYGNYRYYYAPYYYGDGHYYGSDGGSNGQRNGKRRRGLRRLIPFGGRGSN